MNGDQLLKRAREITAEYIRRYSLPMWVESEDCISEVVEALLLLHRENPDDVTSGLEWLRGRDRIRNMLDRDANQRGDVVGSLKMT